MFIITITTYYAGGSNTFKTIYPNVHVGGGAGWKDKPHVLRGQEDKLTTLLFVVQPLSHVQNHVHADSPIHHVLEGHNKVSEGR